LSEIVSLSFVTQHGVLLFGGQIRARPQKCIQEDSCVSFTSLEVSRTTKRPKHATWFKVCILCLNKEKDSI